MSSATPTKTYKPTSYLTVCTPELNDRLLRLLATQLGFHLALSILFQAKLSDGISGTAKKLLSPEIWLFSLALSAVSCCLLFVRKSQTTVRKKIYPTLWSEIVTLITKSNAWFSVLPYTIGGFFLTRMYMTVLHDEKCTEDLLIYPQGNRYGARQLNEQSIFLSMFGLVLGTVYGVKRIMKDRNIIRFPAVQQAKRHVVKSQIATIAHNSAWFSSRVILGNYILYLVFRRTIYWHGAHIAGLFTKMLDTPIISFGWLNIYLFLQLFLSGGLISFSWELFDQLYDMYLTQPLVVSQLALDANPCLLSGLQMHEKPFIQALAYSELARISKSDHHRRATIYNDIGTNNVDSAWKKISNECMKTIDEVKNTIVAEYRRSDVIPPPVQLRSDTATERTVSIRTITPIEQEISNSRISRKPVVAYQDEDVEDRTGDILRSIAELPKMLPVTHSKVTTVADSFNLEDPKKELEGWLARIHGYIRQWPIWNQLFSQGLVRKVQSLFPNSQITLYAIESLSNLTCASLKEDECGQVQRDIPVVIDCMLGCLQEVESLMYNPPASYSALTASSDSRITIREPLQIINALKSGLYQIVITFEPYLSEFKVQPKYSTKWQSLIKLED
ncbi:nucleoporin protein Ndc1-Nup [Umbelopsis sp. PMI_123]|nr:nucleoporin protein Ndc1-Nup [Umbelopsis sp. PMI_123]